MTWHLRGGTLVVDPHGTDPERPAPRDVAPLAERVFSDASAAFIRRERARHPVCDRYGVRVESCLACGGRGCTEALREELARARAAQ